MAQASSFRSGMVLELENELWEITDAQLIMPGKGGAFVRTKLKQLQSGRVIERSFRSEEKIKDVRVEKKSMQYLYSDGGHFFFMDQATYEQISVDREFVGNAVNYLKEGNDVEILFHGAAPIGIELPFFVDLKITKTDPGLKGDTVSGATKPATLETGAVVMVPLFIEEGNLIKIDTRTNEYVERA